MLIYWDSVVLIYLLDGTGAFQARARSRLEAMKVAGDEVAVSDLTRLECRVLPIRNSDGPSLQTFDAFFVRPAVHIIPITTAVFDRATDLRAKYGFKATDAIHLATAITGSCGSFLTNDDQLDRCKEIPVEILP